MKKNITVILFIVFTYFSYAQFTFVKKWDKRFGGFDNETLHIFQKTLDGGCIAGGSSYSGVGGDKTQPLWGGFVDYWVVKVDSLGNKLWDKRFGTTGGDYIYAINYTNDGGYILGGISAGAISGDKTEPGRGGSDYGKAPFAGASELLHYL